MISRALTGLVCWACRSHYTVGMENIAVNGVNITTAASFAVTATGGGVIMDSGTTLAYLVEPAYTQFVTAVSIYNYDFLFSPTNELDTGFCSGYLIVL